MSQENYGIFSFRRRMTDEELKLIRLNFGRTENLGENRTRRAAARVGKGFCKSRHGVVRGGMGS